MSEPGAGMPRLGEVARSSGHLEQDSTVLFRPDGWSEMDLRELHEAGLLWHVNRAVLWPLGLALTIEYQDDEPVRLFVQRLDPFEAIASGDDHEDEAGRLDSLTAWLRRRVSA